MSINNEDQNRINNAVVSTLTALSQDEINTNTYNAYDATKRSVDVLSMSTKDQVNWVLANKTEKVTGTRRQELKRIAGDLMECHIDDITDEFIERLHNAQEGSRGAEEDMVNIDTGLVNPKKIRELVSKAYYHI